MAIRLHLQSIVIGISLLLLMACSSQTAQSSNHQLATPILNSTETGSIRADTNKIFTSIYAMDVLVFGTHPEVYNPPAIPPFTKKQAFARLLPVARHLQFIAKPIHTAPSPIALPATYSGQLPCADCPGIVYQLNLLVYHRYHLRLNYQDRHAQFDEQGCWRLSNDTQTLVLQNQGQPQQWAVLNGGQRLRLLNSSGHPIHSNLNYDLTRQALFKPLAPNGSMLPKKAKRAAGGHYEQRSRCRPTDK